MTDTTRQTYRELTDDEKGAVAAIKGHAEDLIGFLKTRPASREISLAITKIEEAVMWGVKGITG